MLRTLYSATTVGLALYSRAAPKGLGGMDDRGLLRAPVHREHAHRISRRAARHHAEHHVLAIACRAYGHRRRDPSGGALCLRGFDRTGGRTDYRRGTCLTGGDDLTGVHLRVCQFREARDEAAQARLAHARQRLFHRTPGGFARGVARGGPADRNPGRRVLSDGINLRLRQRVPHNGLRNQTVLGRLPQPRVN